MSGWPDAVVALLAKLPDATPENALVRLSGVVARMEEAGPPTDPRALRGYRRRLAGAKAKLQALREAMGLPPA